MPRRQRPLATLPQDDLERWIREAGDYVIPTRDLRPRVIEAAKQSSLDRRQMHRASWLAITAGILWLSLHPLSMVAMRIHAKLRGPSALELHTQAIRSACEPHENLEWCLAQAILASRQLNKTDP